MACAVRWTTAWHPGSSQCPAKVASLAAPAAVGQALALQQAGHVASALSCHKSVREGAAQVPPTPHCAKPC